MNHTRLRDRTLKILQYGSQFLIGFYGAAISRRMREQLHALQVSSSTARKAFWILKSIDNLSTALTQWDAGYFKLNYDNNSNTTTTMTSILQKLDAFENLCIMWYYWCETKVFFARSSNCFNLHESGILEYNTNLSWVLGDLAYFCSSLLRLKENTDKIKNIERRIYDIKHIAAEQQCLIAMS